MRSGVLATALSVSVIAIPASLSAQAAPAPAACPAALPTAQAVDGLTGTGLTVERGVTPEPFNATVLGRISNGIAPGVDMIMADLSSPALTRAGGVWAGMSGSPVYTTDGQLIGAVAYGLAANSPIAGITPAADMKKLVTLAGAAGGNKKVAVTKTVAAKLAKTGDVTTSEALGGFRRLPVPVTVSGVDLKQSAKRTERLRKAFPDTQLVTGSAVPGTAAAPADIVPGGNFGAAISYGAVSLAGVGTTTLVCDNKAVAWGHPFLYGGANNRMSAHSASAVYVQPDGLFGPFKVANFGGVVGTVDQDRLAGIRAQLGATPASTAITSSLKVGSAAAETMTTRAVADDYVSIAAFYHTLAAFDKGLDSIGQGSAAVTISVRGTRANGKAFEVRRTDNYADRYDIAGAVGFEVYDLVESIASQSLENVKITNVSISGAAHSKISEYRVTGVKVKKGSTYVKAGKTISVKAGTTLATQVTLSPYRNVGTPKTLNLDLKVAKSAAGGSGYLSVSGARGSADEEGGEFPESEPTTFDALLKSLASAPKNNQVGAFLEISLPNEDEDWISVKKVASINAAVAPSALYFDVNVTR